MDLILPLRVSIETLSVVGVVEFTGADRFVFDIEFAAAAGVVDLWPDVGGAVAVVADAPSEDERPRLFRAREVRFLASEDIAAANRAGENLPFSS